VKTVILAGGLGTRLAEETALRPKPMVEIGGKPILWHIMSMYAAHGHREFVIACGYLGEVIKQYFGEFSYHNADWTIDLADGSRTVVKRFTPDWRVHLIDTGFETLTGGRLLRLRSLLGNEPFMVTYGDGVSDIDIRALVAFHRAHGKLATVSAVRPAARFGGLDLEGDRVSHFSEKSQTAVGWINGGFFVFQPEVLDYIVGDHVSLEREPLERLAANGQLMAFRHDGFWQPMDTIRERRVLEALWQSGKAPWAVWK
jgi:glucose-1-phosphate cytidylyltransferase